MDPAEVGRRLSGICRSNECFQHDDESMEFSLNDPPDQAIVHGGVAVDQDVAERNNPIQLGDLSSQVFIQPSDVDESAAEYLTLALNGGLNHLVG